MSIAKNQAQAQAQARARRRRRDAVETDTTIVNYLLLVLLFLAPFFRGLFFYDELLIAHIYTGVVAAIYFYLNREKLRLSKSLMDYAAIGLILAYVLSAVGAVNFRDGVGSVMKLANYFLIYLLVASGKDAIKMKNVLIVFFLSGLGVALAGIGTAFGTFSFHGAYDDGLISSTIQYHNAAAIFMFATGMIGLILTSIFDGASTRALSAGGVYVTFITAVGAGSRGALLIAPIAMLVQFIGLPRAEKEKYFYTALAVFVPVMATAKSVLTFQAHTQGFYWGMLLLGFAVTALMQFGFDRFILLGGKVKRTYVLSAAVVILVAIAAVLFVKGPDILPTSVSDRLSQANLQNSNVQDRFNFWNDALKIIKDHSLLGVGGGGWKSIYRSYQSYPYDTTEVHNHFLQIWVESGTIGFVFYMLLWLGLILSGIRVLLRSQSPEMKAISWTAFSAALAIGMHSAIDFTLSESALAFFLWAMMGLVKAAEEHTLGAEDNYFFGLTFSSDIKRYVGIAISVVFFIASTSLYIGSAKADAAIKSYNNGDMEDAISEMESAAFFNPVSSDNYLNLSEMYVDQAARKRDRSLLSKSLEAAEAAARLNSADSDTQQNLAKAYFNNGKYDKSLTAAEKSVSFAPFMADQYDELAMYYNAVAGAYLSKGDKASARQVLDKTLAIPQRMNDQAAKLTEEGKRLSKRPIDQISPKLQKYLDEAQKLKAGL